MTTIITKRTKDWFEIVADKRATGWYMLVDDTKTKLVENTAILSNWLEIPYVISITWDSLHNEIVNEILNDIKKLPEHKRSLLHYLQLIHKSIKEICWIKDAELSIMFVTKNLALMISNQWYIEEIKDFWSMWSWFEIASWIHLCNPRLSITEYIPLISKLDIKTSKEFTYIKL